jgi:ADP-ribose pyrophosphatase YjhB (NUDIX family)
MSYIQELRQKIGNAPVIMVGATVLILNDQGELMMLLRTDNDCWGVPGGSMEPGEHLEDTACRETLEETGLKIKHLHLFDVFSGPELYYRYPNGAEVYNVSAVYVATEVSGEIEVNPAEHRQWKFYSLANLPDPISPPIKPILERFTNAKVISIFEESAINIREITQ